MEKINRLNYIGSKFQLLEWIDEIIKEKTNFLQYNDKTIVDLFAGTGIVSNYFRKYNSIIISNDAELYSSVITHALSISIYTEKCKIIIKEINENLENKDYENLAGFVTKHYSPFEFCERMFFTVDNAKRIDFIKNKLNNYKSEITVDEYKFLLASLLISSDTLANVAAVYGSYLKKFKSKALVPLMIKPIHLIKEPSNLQSKVFQMDVLIQELYNNITNVDIIYIDPPYNQRQYSKNYFPLNIIAKPEEDLESCILNGKTGIPADCFVSPFCQKKTVKQSFIHLYDQIKNKTKWLFLSYNSESLLSKQEMINIMEKYGTVSVEEKEYKRFKSYEYNDDKKIKEYLFCLNLNR